MPVSFSIWRAENLLCRARADGRVGHFVGVRLGITEERFEIRRRDRVRERKAIIVFRNQRDRCDLVELERHVPVDGGVDGFEVGAKEEGVAVARLRENIAGRDHSSGGRLVLDHDTCPERLPEPVGNEARWDVGRSAGTEAHHQPDRPCRIVVGGWRDAGGRHQSGKHYRTGPAGRFRAPKMGSFCKVRRFLVYHTKSST